MDENEPYSQGEVDVAAEAIPKERQELVNQKLAGVAAAKKKWDFAFKRMRADMKFAEGQQLRLQKEDDDRVQVDIVQRHINSRTAALYAKNPTAVAKRRPRLDFAVWDERPESLQRVQQKLASGMPPSPQDMALMQDVVQGVQSRRMYDRLGKTMTYLFAYSLDEQQPPYKSQAKQQVVRTLTCGVSYQEVGFHRALKKAPEVQEAIDDATSQIATLMRLQTELGEGELDTYGPDIERQRLILQDLQSSEDIVVREGLVVNFPASTRVIPDTGCTNLDGFIGCREVSIEYPLTREEILERYEVDVKGKAKAYQERQDGTMKAAVGDCDRPKFCVYRIFNKDDGLVYTVCEGYPDFLEEPARPDIFVEGFWPIEALVFNRMESENNPFPRSDVRLLMPLQREINRLAEGLRQHRIAARPQYVSAPGALDEDEKKNLSQLGEHEVLELANADRPVDELIQQIKKASIDPNLYTPDPIYDAINKVVGSQEANMGGTAGGTATESSIAEASRISSLASNADDLDDHLSRVARKAGGVLLTEMSQETVKRVIGPGAIWPQYSNQEVAEEIFLEIKAGSTGRPNRAQELANWEKGMPFLLQMPGISPEWIVQTFLGVLDDRIDLTDAYTAGIPSIVQQNQAKQIGTGDPATDPNQQGGQGGNNAPNNDEAQGGPQPAYPTALPMA